MADAIVGDVKAVGADVVAEKNKAVQFVKDRWPHFVTWILTFGGSAVWAFVKAHL